MKTFALFALLAFLGTTGSQTKIFPNVQIKTLDGRIVNASDLQHDGPVLVSYWATWCSPCKKELEALHEHYIDLQEETGVKIIAISIDDPRTADMVSVDVNSRGWEFDVYLDTNSDLRRAMGVNNVPHTVIYSASGKEVYVSNKYNPGDEYHLMDMVRQAAAE